MFKTILIFMHVLYNSFQNIVMMCHSLKTCDSLAYILVGHQRFWRLTAETAFPIHSDFTSFFVTCIWNSFVCCFNSIWKKKLTHEETSSALGVVTKLWTHARSSGPYHWVFFMCRSLPRYATSARKEKGGIDAEYSKWKRDITYCSSGLKRRLWWSNNGKISDISYAPCEWQW